MTYRTLVKDRQKDHDRPNPNITEVCQGQYLHILILSGLKLSRSDIVKKGDSCIKHQVNIDGLLLWNSSSTHLWPILGRILDKPDAFPIGVLYGSSEPSDTSFLTAFVQGFWGAARLQARSTPTTFH